MKNAEILHQKVLSSKSNKYNNKNNNNGDTSGGGGGRSRSSTIEAFSNSFNQMRERKL